jgi:hypothetical protein
VPLLIGRGIHGVDIAEEKLTKFLLNFDSGDGRSRAKFLREFGFETENRAELARALILHGQTAEVARDEPNEWGRRIHVEGPMWSPVGIEPNVRTVWQLRRGQTVAWFVTLKPLPKLRDA